MSDGKKRLRQYLNSSIAGPKTDAILEALGTGADYLIENVEAVNDSLYVVTAKGRYLDAKMADRNITRPDNVGLSDEVFREIGIQISNRKQVRDLVTNILRIMYGEEFTRATMISNNFEPYALQDGDTLIIQYDDAEIPVEIVFKSSQFANIGQATAQEVADAITREIRRLGRTGSALAKDDGLGGYVELISDTDGTSSSIRVLGGRAQNELNFPQIRPTSADASTEWTLSVESGGAVRATWTGGADPSIGKVRVNDYVNIYGSAFNLLNRGTFTVSTVQGGGIGNAYVEFSNPNGINEVVVQGVVDAILFYTPQRSLVNSKLNFAALYQTESRILEIFMPATTRVVRREREGSAHLHESGPAGIGNEGPFVYDESKPYVIGGEEANTTMEVNSSSGNIITVDDSSAIPDEPGFLVFDFGGNNEEGPVPYIARPSSNTLVLDPSYIFQNNHANGTNISHVAQNFPVEIDKDGTDYSFYITDIVSGRIYAEELIRSVMATGINVIFYILYPNDEGLGKWGTENSEKTYVWGPDNV